MEAFEQAWCLLKDFTFRPDLADRGRGFYNWDTDWAGVNLSARGNQSKRPGNPVHLENLANTLLHEHAHRAINSELWDAVERGELPRENLGYAHEAGALNLEHPGGQEADRDANDLLLATIGGWQKRLGHPEMWEEMQAHHQEYGEYPREMPQPYISE